LRNCQGNKRNKKGKKSHFKKESTDVVVASDNYEFVGVTGGFCISVSWTHDYALATCV